jgi:hypothetical protein
MDQIGNAKRTFPRFCHSDNDAEAPPLREAFGLLLVGLDGLVQHSVQALDKDGGVFQWHAFEQECLIKEEPGRVFYLAVAGVGEQLSDDLVIWVDLERGLQLG